MRKVCLCCFLSALSLLANGRVIPAGTEISVRLLSKVASDQSKPKDPVEAVVVIPVVLDGDVVLPAGTKLRGSVLEAKPALRADERAVLKLDFQELAGTEPLKMKSRVLLVDNARESVDDTGNILGIVASETITARIDQGIDKVAKRSSAWGDILGMAKTTVFKPAVAEIQYAPGVEMTIRLLEPITWTGASEAPAGLTAQTDMDTLYRTVNAQPFQTFAEKPPKPSDITNLMFLGSRQQLEAAFKAAGWDTAHDLTKESVLETMRSIAELRGYKEAPMSVLLLEKRAPDLVYQKQLNTFAKRHHLRIWQRDAEFDGKPVWVSSSTHDIGIEFSEANRTFIHVIDPQIDRERAKIVGDLVFTGKARALALVDRPGVPRKSRNATGDDIVTDGKMAVVALE